MSEPRRGFSPLELGLPDILKYLGRILLAGASPIFSGRDVRYRGPSETSGVIYSPYEEFDRPQTGGQSRGPGKKPKCGVSSSHCCISFKLLPLTSYLAPPPMREGVGVSHHKARGNAFMSVR